MIILLHCAWELSLPARGPGQVRTKLPTLLVDLDQISEPAKAILEEAVRSKPRHVRLVTEDARALYDSAKEALAELPALVETSVVVLNAAARCRSCLRNDGDHEIGCGRPMPVL